MLRVDMAARVRMVKLYYKIREASNIQKGAYRNVQDSYSGPHPK